MRAPGPGLLAVLVVGPGAASCAPPGGGPLAWPEAAETAVFAVQPEGAEVQTFAAVDGADLRRTAEVTLPRGGRGAALGFEAPLEALQLEPGALDLVRFRDDEPCADRRARPLWTALFMAESRAGGWAETSSLPSLFRGYGLPPLDARRCFRRRACPDRPLRRCVPCSAAAPPAAPERPAAPRPPRRCPDCAPGPPAGDPACPAGQRFDLAADRCLRVGAPCPSGRFHEGEPSSADTVFVDPEAPPDGPGTRARPYRRLEAAIARGPARYVLAPGTYDVGDLRLRGWVEGACPSATRVRGRVVIPAGATSTVARVTVEGQVYVARGAKLGLRGARVDAGAQAGIAVDGEAWAGDVAATSGGIGVLVGPGARLALEGVDVRAALPLLGRGGTIQAADGVFLQAGDDPDANAVRLEDRARLTLARALVDAGTGRGVFVEAGRADLSDVFVWGRGAKTGVIAATASAGVALERAEVRGFRTAAVLARRGAQVRALDLEVSFGRGTRSGASHGLGAFSGRLDIRRARVRGPYREAVWVTRASTSTVRDVDVAGARIGFYLEDSQVQVERARVDDAEEEGVLLGSAGRVRIFDLSVRGAGVSGVEVGRSFGDRLTAEIERARVSGAYEVGILIRRISSRISDVEVVSARRGLEIAPGLGGFADRALRLSRVRVSGAQLGFVLDGLEPNLGRVLVPRDIEVRDSGTGLRVRACYAGQGELFSALTFGGGVAEPVDIVDE